jgi:hypothetical protein
MFRRIGRPALRCVFEGSWLGAEAFISFHGKATRLVAKHGLEARRLT